MLKFKTYWHGILAILGEYGHEQNLTKLFPHEVSLMPHRLDARDATGISQSMMAAYFQACLSRHSIT